MLAVGLAALLLGLLRSPQRTFLTISESKPKARQQWAIEVTSQMGARKKLVLGIPIDVNRVGTEELALVPGISEGLARRIIRQRESRGPFQTWHDLRKVKGLGPMRIKGLERYLQLGAPPSCPAPAPDAGTS